MELKKNNGSEEKGKAAAPPLKMSEMIIEYADDFIKRGKDIQEKQKHLDIACAAWNISLFSEKKREKALHDYVNKYESEHPDIDSVDIDALRKETGKLMQKKIKLFPDVKRLIIGAQIGTEKGEDRISVASTVYY
jgi:hypothetical protein